MNNFPKSIADFTTADVTSRVRRIWYSFAQASLTGSPIVEQQCLQAGHNAIDALDKDLAAESSASTTPPHTLIALQDMASSSHLLPHRAIALHLLMRGQNADSPFVQDFMALSETMKKSDTNFAPHMRYFVKHEITKGYKEDSARGAALAGAAQIFHLSK